MDELNCEAGDNIAWQKSKAAPVANRTAPARRADRINEVRYEAKKSGKSKAAGKKAVNKVGSSRKRVEASLTR